MESRKEIIIVGGSLTGAAYANLFNQALNQETIATNITIYEKRPEEDIDNLNKALIYLREESLEKLLPFIREELFNVEDPKAYIYDYNTSLPLVEKYCCVRIDHLLHALLNAAERNGITIKRRHKFISFERNEGDTQTTAHFIDEEGNNVTQQCDYLILGTGFQGIKEILEDTAFNKPIELHATYTLGASVPVDFNALGIHPSEISSIFFRPNYNVSCFNLIKTFFWASLGYFDKSIGNFSVYLATLKEIAAVVTYPPALHDFYMNDKQAQVNLLKQQLEILKEKGEGFHYTWAATLRNAYHSANKANFSYIDFIKCIEIYQLLLNNISRINNITSVREASSI